MTNVLGIPKSRFKNLSKTLDSSPACPGNRKFLKLLSVDMQITKCKAIFSYEETNKFGFHLNKRLINQTDV